MAPVHRAPRWWRDEEQATTAELVRGGAHLLLHGHGPVICTLSALRPGATGRRLLKVNVYLSHHSADAGWARRIAARLETAGMSIVDPNLEIRAGDNWAVKLGSSLEKADAMVVVVSPHASKSEWLAHEVGFALGARRFEGRVIPVVVSKSGTRGLPWSLEMFQSIDLTKNVKAGLDNLARALSSRSRVVAPSPSTPTR